MNELKKSIHDNTTGLIELNIISVLHCQILF